MDGNSLSGRQVTLICNYGQEKCELFRKFSPNLDPVPRKHFPAEAVNCLRVARTQQPTQPPSPAPALLPSLNRDGSPPPPPPTVGARAPRRSSVRVFSFVSIESTDGRSEGTDGRR